MQHCPTQDTTQRSQELDPSWIEFHTTSLYAHNHIHHKQRHIQ